MPRAGTLPAVPITDDIDVSSPPPDMARTGTIPPKDLLMMPASRSTESAALNSPRHTTTTMILHWGAAVILIAAFTLGLLLDDWPRDAGRATAMMIHYSLGTLIMAAAMIRLLRKLVLPQPAAPGDDLMDRAAAAMHWVLYAVMVALPLTGMLDRWARGRPLTIFGDILVPAPFPIPGGKLWKETHEVLAWTLVALVGIHVLAALFHHVVLRDEVLRRMVPGLRPLVRGG